MRIGIADFKEDVGRLADAIKKSKLKFACIYGIPRGGIHVATELASLLDVPMVDEINHYRPGSVLLVDDIYDSGETMRRWVGRTGHPFAVLYMKGIKQQDHEPIVGRVLLENDWIDFWYEGSEDSVHENIRRILQYLGEDPYRDGLKNTPERVIRSYQEIFAGYKIDPESVFTVFDSERYDQMVVLRGIELYSTCEHHMLPFVGQAHIAYVPSKKIIGVSKLARLMEIYSRRLQVQERIGEQIVDALMKYLQPRGAACVIEARHMCMCARGVGKQNSIMITSSLRGVFQEEDSARAEFMNLIKS